MTVYEHAMLGVTGALATGLDRRYGWQIVAMAGFTSILPDWDGLSLVLGGGPFDQVHRTVGHSLLVATLLGAAVAALDYRYSIALRVRDSIGRRIHAIAPKEPSIKRSVFRPGELAGWVVVGVLASLGHLAADLVYSCHERLPDWGLRLFWPFSDRVWAYPLVPWGKVGTPVIFAAGMFAMVRWPTRLQRIAVVTLALLLIYVAVRRFLGGGVW
jgi:membrane-bound metal-dependent hydrolase YbcI (DUF457 family)